MIVEDGFGFAALPRFSDILYEARSRLVLLRQKVFQPLIIQCRGCLKRASPRVLSTSPTDFISLRNFIDVKALFRVCTVSVKRKKVNIFRLLKLSNNLARKILFLYRVGNAASFNPGNVVTRITSALYRKRSILFWKRKVALQSP